MYITGSKKMMNICILKVLEQYSDFNHKLTQQEIINHVMTEYGMECERKAIGRNITVLMEFGYDIENDGGWYLASRKFEDAELRLLIDSLFCSKNIAARQCKVLIQKLEELSNTYFRSKVRHVSNLSNMEHTDNQQVFLTTEMLDDAIEGAKQVAFYYNTYGMDKQLYPRRETKDIVNPYQIVSANGRYYLIGNYDKYDNVVHFRLDRITEIELLDKNAKPMNTVKGLEHGLNLPKHMAEHIYMCGGESVKVCMKVKTDDLVTCHLVGEMIDWFGKDFNLADGKNSYTLVHLRMNENAMYYWAMQYGQYFEILEPKSLRDRIKNVAKDMASRYEQEV